MPKRAAALLGAALAVLLALPATAAATTNGPIAQTGGMEATLPLLGTTLTVGVSLDATGNISGVALNPTGTVSQTSADSGQVTFSNTDGSVKVKVWAGGSRLTIAARATLASLSGTGTWKADVFGTGTKSSVGYTVGDDGTGKPTLALGTVSPAAGIVATTWGPRMTAGEDGKGGTATAVVTFAANGFVKRLSITVRVGDDGTATLKLTLSGKDRQRLTGTLAQLAGSRTWSAHLCDGTAVGVQYHVTTDGQVVFDAATGAPATSTTLPVFSKEGTSHFWRFGDKDKAFPATFVSGFLVRFTNTRVSFSAILVKRADGSYALIANGRSGMCWSGDRTDSKSGSWSGFGTWGGSWSGGTSGDGSWGGGDWGGHH